VGSEAVKRKIVFENASPFNAHMANCIIKDILEKKIKRTRFQEVIHLQEIVTIAYSASFGLG